MHISSLLPNFVICQVAIYILEEKVSSSINAPHLQLEEKLSPSINAPHLHLVLKLLLKFNFQVSKTCNGLILRLQERGPWPK